jgi:hydrogenase maturation protease
MSRPLVDRIAGAVLYEGYILYPYRPSIKNRQRWTFGGLYPRSYCQAQRGADAWSNQTECLVAGSPYTSLEVRVRFLHLTERQVGEIVPPISTWTEGTEPRYRPVEALQVGGRLFHSWQEAQEREVTLSDMKMGDLLDRPRRRPLSFPGKRWLEPIAAPSGEVEGVLVREQHAVEAACDMSAAALGEKLFRLTIRVFNLSAFDSARTTGRDDALLRSLVSTHSVMLVRGGEFVSLVDPPQEWQQAAEDCRNIGAWPVMVGEEGQRDTMLSSPIILYDYPQVASESPGDFFDGTEIDEMLTLRIMTLTDEEKRSMASVDDRARQLLTRTQGLAAEELARLHGTVRGRRPLAEVQSDA